MQWYHLSMGSRQLSQVKYVQACKDMFGKNRGKLGTAGFGSGDLIDDFCLRQDWTTVKVSEDNMPLKM